MENQSFIVCSSSIISIIKTQSFDAIFMTIISINPYSIKLNYLIPSLITLYFTIVWCYSIIWKSIIKTYYLTFIWLFNFFDLFLKICYNVLFEIWTFFSQFAKQPKQLLKQYFWNLFVDYFQCWLQFLKTPVFDTFNMFCQLIKWLTWLFSYSTFFLVSVLGGYSGQLQ